eukprot:10642632-Lingulodinium_polyedra.AAC.1
MQLRRFYGSVEELVSDMELRRLLRAWSRKSKVCNVHVERILAIVRTSSPQRLPFAERFCGAGLLAQ